MFGKKTAKSTYLMAVQHFPLTAYDINETKLGSVPLILGLIKYDGI